MKNETKANSVSFFDYDMISLGDTADWKAALTVIVVGWVDIATTVIQVVRDSTRVSSTRPQVAVRRLIAEAAATEEAAPSSVNRIILYV